MLVRNMMLAMVMAVFVASPVLLVQVQAAEAGIVKSDSFKYVSKSVEVIQIQLRKAGYRPGRVDGIFGPETSLAIIQYQKDHGLPQTGYPNSKLLALLKKK